MDQAELGISALSEFVDSLVIIPNERLKQVSESRITLLNAFEISDDVLRHGVQSISELINVPGFVNLDFADVTAVMKDAGYAHMGVGEGTGKDKAEIAAKAAISSPLLETSISGANGILINITASPDIGLEDIDLASTMITNEASDNATVIWGASFDPELEDKMKITIIATGFANVRRSFRRWMRRQPLPLPRRRRRKPRSLPRKTNSLRPRRKRTESFPRLSPSAISEDDFNELMGMLKKQKNPGNGGF